jgi:hypothetical protein
MDTLVVDTRSTVEDLHVGAVGFKDAKSLTAGLTIHITRSSSPSWS